MYTYRHTYMHAQTNTHAGTHTHAHRHPHAHTHSVIPSETINKNTWHLLFIFTQSNYFLFLFSIIEKEQSQKQFSFNLFFNFSNNRLYFLCCPGHFGTSLWHASPPSGRAPHHGLWDFASGGQVSRPAWYLSGRDLVPERRQRHPTSLFSAGWFLGLIFLFFAGEEGDSCEMVLLFSCTIAPPGQPPPLQIETDLRQRKIRDS